MRKILTSLLIILIQLAHSGSAPVALTRSVVLDAAVMAALAQSGDEQPLDVIITLRDQADLSQLDRVAVPDGLRRHAVRAQAGLLAALKAQPADRVRAVTPLWIINAVALSASRQVIVEVAQRPDVARIQLADGNWQIEPEGDAPAMPANLAAIGAPAAWQRGFTGQGVVVAVLDSGVDLLNAELAAKWRGGSNSWFDPYGEHAAPVDLSGHGTQVLGVILGGKVEGQPIGVAPGAQWIAARIFNDRGHATTLAIHRALQWVIDPDGNPATHDAPQVVNNSWSAANAGCDSEFAADLRALRAAGILPIFAAGSSRPIGPANLPEAFAVGALAADGTALIDSARGPSICRPTGEVYPQLVAPGEDIRTLDHYGAVITTAGTSLAAAHVSGALALLLSARPRLSADEQAALLIGTAADLGEPGADNTFGYGQLNIAALIDRVAPVGVSAWLVIGVSSVGVLLAGAVFIARHTRSSVVSRQSSQAAHTHWQDLDS